MKILPKILVVFTFILCSFNITSAQTKKEKEAAIAQEVNDMVNAKTYMFVATYANSSGGSFQVSSNYNLKIQKDSVTAYLPYYGNSHFSVDDPTNGTIKFTWTAFNYTIKAGKNGKLEVDIKPVDKSISDVEIVTLRISPDGSASLQVATNNRGSISFDGYLADKY